MKRLLGTLSKCWAHALQRPFQKEKKPADDQMKERAPSCGSCVHVLHRRRRRRPTVQQCTSVKKATIKWKHPDLGKPILIEANLSPTTLL